MNNCWKMHVKTVSASADGKSLAFPPLSPAAQKSIVAGGAEKRVASRLRGKRLIVGTALCRRVFRKGTPRQSEADYIYLYHPRYPWSPEKFVGSLRVTTLTDKVELLWLNTELRGCPATAWATM